MDAITDEADGILRTSQVIFTVLALILALCGVFVLLIWRTHRDMLEKDSEIELQEQLFNMLSTYLSNNTDDVYMLVDIEKHSVDYISPNVERVLGVSRESVENRLESFGRAEYESGNTVEFETLDSMKEGDSMDAVKTERINVRTGEPSGFRRRRTAPPFRAGERLPYTYSTARRTARHRRR